MLRTLSLTTLLLASLAYVVPLLINGVYITFSGCDEINPKTGNRMSKDIEDAWDDAIKLANSITEIDTKTDIGSFDC